jgi:hypothetical protein
VDLLNFGQFSGALRDIVLNPATQTPFIIGIFVRWGTGKTTLMRMVERDLQPSGLHTIWFSAWLYGQEQEIWAAFLQSLTTRLWNKLKLLEKTRFSVRLFRRGLAWERLLFEVPKYLARLALSALPVFAGMLLSERLGGELGRLVNSAGIVGSADALIVLLKPVAKAAFKDTSPDFSLYRSMDFEQHIGFLEKIREQFERIIAALPGQTGRIVVFVDDLDRCSPEKALQLLDAIKVFFDVPGCIFVIGLDYGVVQQALALKFPQNTVAQREYLAKFIQLPFQLPPLTDSDLESYLSALDVRFPDERCRAVLLSSLARNPREIKRVINVYSLYWYLGRAANASLHPVRLAKVIVIQPAFEPLFALVREHPEWLAAIERAMLAQAGVQTMGGIGVPPALEPFLTEPILQMLLTMHEVDLHQHDASFGELSTEEIAVYFTLTKRIVQPSHETPSGNTSDRSLGDEPLLDFDRYRVLERIATSGISELFIAEERQTGRRFALKKLISTLAQDPEWRARFDREATIHIGLHHPNIAALVETGTVDIPGRQPVQFSVMELITGRTLLGLQENVRQFSPAQARKILVPLFDALAYIHSMGIVHRDIKPLNIMITPTDQPKIIDFGLAILTQDQKGNLRESGESIFGTPLYMSTEQMAGEPLDGRSDLYSLGVVIYECLVGQHPFGRPETSDVTMAFSEAFSEEREIIPPTAANPKLTAAMNDCILRLLAKSPSDRYPDAGIAKIAFFTALDSFIGDAEAR